MEEPTRLNGDKAGADGSIVLNRTKKSTGILGANAATDESGDPLKDSIIDPTKVAHTASHNAASVAGPLFIREVMMAEKREEEKASGIAVAIL